jgi:mannose-1-phosphate guanylyltransferase/phosphomannomutase
MQHTKAVVMAGGEGSRLRPLTLERPKPLAPVANRPIMEHILRLLKRQGIHQAAATLYYRADDIERAFGNGSDLGMELVYTREDRPLGTAGSVRLAEDFLGKEPFVIISGDALTDYDLRPAMEFHRQKGSLATLVLARVPNPKEFGIVITEPDGRVQRFLEKPDWSEVFTDTVNTGIYIIDPAVFRLIEPGRSVDWSQDVFPQLLRDGAPLYGYVMPGGYWSDIGALDQFLEAQMDVLHQEVEVEMPGEEIRPGIWLGPGAVLDDEAIIEGRCLIGAGARVKAGARLEAGVVLGPGVIVDEQAVVRGSVVMANAYVGAGTLVQGAILGERVLMKRDAVVGEGAVVGDRTVLESDSEVRPGVKVWPDKVLERGARLSSSLVAARRWRGSIFRSLGVAGISNIELTPDFAVRLGLAFGSSLPLGSTVVSARDSTRSSRMTKRAFMSGLLSSGVNVIDIQSAPMPVTRHHVVAERASGGSCVRKFPTNSRLTLMELFDEDGSLLGLNRQRRVEGLFFREDFRRADSEELGEMDYSGRAVEMYVSHLRELLPQGGQAPRTRVVLDYGYSSIARMFPQVLADLDLQAISLNAVNDGKKAPRTVQRLRGHMENVSHIVESLGYDFGVLVSHEGERLSVVDNRGRILSGHQLLGILARLMAPENSGGKVVLPASSPRGLVEMLRELGLQPILSGLAEADVSAACRREGAFLAGDGQGGIIIPTLTGGADAMFAMAQLAVRLDQTGQSLWEAASELPSMEVTVSSARCPWDAKGMVMRELSERSEPGVEVSHDHGVRFETPEGWVLVTPDTFEPVFHIFAEGNDPSASRELADRYRIVIEELQEA